MVNPDHSQGTQLPPRTVVQPNALYGDNFGGCPDWDNVRLVLSAKEKILSFRIRNQNPYPKTCAA